jgi:hypothetical protein
MKALKKPETQVPATIGTAFEGGFYGGKIKVGKAICAIVWAPKAQGEIFGEWSYHYTPFPGAQSCFDSMANTKAMAKAGSTIATQALEAKIGGYNDWCVPALDVLEMGYRYLKPAAEENDVPYHGGNPSSFPIGATYTKNSPAQTKAEAFQEGGAEAFEGFWYWSSTHSENGDALMQDFDRGGQQKGFKLRERHVRFVRCVAL